MKIPISLLCLLTLSSTSHGLNNGLAKTPQMGWNTWNKFGCSITGDLIEQAANQLIQLNLTSLGYQYVNIDDCWMDINRTEDGHFIVDAKAFPKGLKDLGDFIHGKGLLFGIYSSAGTQTCQGRAGSLDHEDTDAADWASWGVDYLKYDNCFNQGRPALERYTAMRDALNKTGRPIFYSICNWGLEEAYSWGPSVGNSWRTTQDISDIWLSIQYNFIYNDQHPESAGIGGWNDPDMLEIGNGGLTPAQEQSHFALWCVAKAPLIIGCDLSTVSPSSLAILKNEELIAVNQDKLGIQGSCKVGCTKDDWFVGNPMAYAAPMQNGDVVVVVVNWAAENKTGIQINFSDVGLSGLVQVRDIVNHVNLGGFQDKPPAFDLDAYSSVSYRLSKIGVI